MKERIEIFKESRFCKQSRGGYYWVVKLVYDLWQENQTYERKKGDAKLLLTTTQQKLDVAVEALEDFAEIAAIAKPNCDIKLRSLIQQAQVKHSEVLNTIRGK